jgi:hypothetical protein
LERKGQINGVRFFEDAIVVVDRAVAVEVKEASEEQQFHTYQDEHIHWNGEQTHAPNINVKAKKVTVNSGQLHTQQFSKVLAEV